jgi:Lambda phage tail tube protein, TTP
MPASQILAARGAQLKRLNPATLIYEAVPQCRVMNTPDITQDYLDGTNHDSPNFFKEYVGGFKDGGDVPVEIVWNPAIAMHNTIYNDLLAQTLLTWRVILNNATLTTFQFTAYVSKFNVPLGYDQIVTAQMSLKVTASPTLTP